MHIHSELQWLKEAKGDDKKESIELNIEELKTALSKVDSQMKFLPATAQVHAIICLWHSQRYLKDACFSVI